MPLGKPGPTSSRTDVVVLFVVNVSVALSFFTGWGARPTPNPPPFSAWLGTVHGGAKFLDCEEIFYQ